MALITVAGYKDRAGITVTTYDVALAVIVSEVEALVAKFCNRRLESTGADLTEKYNGRGNDTLHLEGYPIVSITSVSYLSGVTSGAATFTAYGSGEYYTVADTGELVRYNAIDYAFPESREVDLNWPIGTGNVQVVYQGGYTAFTVPADLSSAMYDLVGILQHGRDGTREAVTDDEVQAFLIERVSEYRRQGL